ncbi:MAG: thymidylate synthase [Lachnospiraceae bacterium]|nr:thymidylate synthase [Lachnospiraceae bacterium]
MSSYDEQYLTIVQNILDHGYFDQNRTGIPTYKLPHQVMQFDLSREFPILTTKKVAFKTAVREILWIYQQQSNDVRELQKQKVHIWDEWMKDDGTIGTAYGWVIKEFDQMDTLLHQLKTDPQSRRMMVNLWQIPYLDTGSLHPCCFLSMWDVTDGRLNCMLVQRSGDMGLGVPFNTTQYAVLTHLIAQSAGLKPGLLTHVINNAHIYENQVEPLKVQLARRDKAYEAPKLVIDPDVSDFYAFTLDHIKLEGYKFHDKISMEVAV